MSKETEPVDNGWKTCETGVEREKMAKEAKSAKSAFTSPREKERQPNEPEPEGESSVQSEFFPLPGQVEDLDSDSGNHQSSITAFLREDDTGNSKTQEKEAAEERESKNVDQDNDKDNETSNDNKDSDDGDEDELGDDEADELDVSSVGTAEEGERPEIILQTTDGESTISNASQTDELYGVLAGLETEKVPMNSDDPTLVSRQEEVCEPAVE